MADRAGDQAKKPPGCRNEFVPFSADLKHDILRDAPNAAGRYMRCPHLKEVGGGMEGEHYHCDVCGESFFLDYEEMK